MAVTTLPAGTSGTAVPNISPSGITLASGKILIGQASGSAAAKTPSGDVTIDVNGVMAIGASKVTEAMQVLADNTTNNVSTTKHGYAPKAPNDATKYLDGTGAWSVPAGGGGGLSQGAINQLFAASPSVSCKPATQQACGAITATVVVTAGNAVLTCSADCREYIKYLSIVSTAAQPGEAAIVQSVSSDGLTITCVGIGEDNPLVTDAVASALKFYGAPAQVIGDGASMAPTVVYNFDDGAGGATAEIRGGFWTGPMFSAGHWFKSGAAATGFLTDASGVSKITDIAANDLSVTAL